MTEARGSGRVEGGFSRWNFREAGGWRSGFIRRRLPPGSGALGGDAARDRYEGWLIWIGGRQGDAHAGFEFLDAHGDLQERPAQRFEGVLAPERAPRCGLTEPVQQPVGAAVQEEPELAGFPAVAGSTYTLTGRTWCRACAP